MLTIRAYIRSLSQRLIFKAIAMFLLATAVAGAILYAVSLQFPLPESYGRAIATISRYKLHIIRNGIYIYALYALFVLAGVLTISLIYSHRVARPFSSIRDCAREMARGNFDVDIKCLEVNGLHPLVESIHEISRNYRDGHEKLHEGVRVLAEEARALEAALKRGDREEFKRVHRSLSATAEKIEGTLSELKR
jgi:HAMP domain-containing protein